MAEFEGAARTEAERLEREEQKVHYYCIRLGPVQQQLIRQLRPPAIRRAVVEAALERIKAPPDPQ